MSKWYLFLASSLFILPLAFAQQQYTLTDIGSLGGDCGGYATAINSSGEVVGFMDTSHTACEAVDNHAFYWSQATGLVDMTTDFEHSQAFGINRQGTVVGGLSGDPPPP